MVPFLTYSRKPEDAVCAACGRSGPDVSRALGVCRECIMAGRSGVGRRLEEARLVSRRGYPMPPRPPRAEEGVRCRVCSNECRMGPGEAGFCGLRENLSGRVHSRAGTARAGLFTAYQDPLPTNCVADWVCAGCSAAGYPDYSYSEGPETGYRNLAVFLAACSFDCVFCQNWTFRENTAALAPLRSPVELADMVDERTSCICYFGGDPSPQMPFALAASRLALERAGGRLLRICWETNGSMHPGLLKKAVSLSVQSGGCIKFDIKAYDRGLNLALTGVDNRRTLENLALAVELSRGRPDPPPVVVSTLMVPGYVGAEEVSRIASFLASLDTRVPYSLLAFHPDFLMGDMGTTTARWADECVDAASAAGLERIKVGNRHLLS